MLLLTKHLNVMGDRKLVSRFVGPFSIVQGVVSLTYQLNLGIFYSQVHTIFHVSLFKLFNTGVDRYPHPASMCDKDEQKWEVSGIL